MASALPKLFQRCVRSCENVQNSCRVINWRECSSFSGSRLTSKPRQCASTHNCLGGSLYSFSLQKTPISSSLGFSASNVLTRNFRTESDTDFSKLLAEEISAEKERMMDVPRPTGNWTLTQKGADCKLSKTLNHDRVQVSFNVNASIPPLESEDPNEEQDIVAQPDFSVEIKKTSNESLSFECYFPDDELNEEEDHQPERNTFSIRSVILHQGEITESTYVIDTDNIDPDVYQKMLTYLRERGINNEFADELVDIATAVENREYISSLEKLQKFIST